MIKTVLFAFLLGGTLAAPALAGNLKYTPISPSFGGNPLNGSTLLGIAGAQNKYAAADSASRSGAGSLTPAQEFAQTFQRRLLLQVSDNITNTIFGTPDQPGRQSGDFVVDGTQISFQRIGNNVQLTINDGVNSTTVVVPVAY